MAFNYSVMLDLEDKTALVVGGGEVAKRKINDLIKSHAKVVIISPIIFDDSIAEYENVEYINRDFKMSDIESWRPFIVFAATNDKALNREIASYCDHKGILINSISDPKTGNLSVQAKIEKEQYCVSVSTYGQGPGFSRALKKHLENLLDDRLDVSVQVYIDIRQWLFSVCDDSANRIQYLRKLNLDKIYYFSEAEHLEYNELLERVKEWLFCS